MKFITCYLVLTFSLATPLAVSAETSALRVFCQGDDVGAEVSVNGEFKGECPVDIQVSPGKLKLFVEKGGRKFVQDIRMGGGVSKRVDVVFPLKATAQKTNNIRTPESVPKIVTYCMSKVMAASKVVGVLFGDYWYVIDKRLNLKYALQIRSEEIEENRAVWSDAVLNQKIRDYDRDLKDSNNLAYYIKAKGNEFNMIEENKNKEKTIYGEIDNILDEYKEAQGVVVEARRYSDRGYDPDGPDDISIKIASEVDKRLEVTRTNTQPSAPINNYGQGTGSALRNTPPPPSAPKQDTFVDKAAQAMTTEACLKVRDKAMTVCDGTPWPLNEGCKVGIRSQYPCNF